MVVCAKIVDETGGKKMRKIKNSLVLNHYTGGKYLGEYNIQSEGCENIKIIGMKDVLLEIKKFIIEWEHENGQKER